MWIFGMVGGFIGSKCILHLNGYKMLSTLNTFLYCKKTFDLSLNYVKLYIERSLFSMKKTGIIHSLEQSRYMKYQSIIILVVTTFLLLISFLLLSKFTDWCEVSISISGGFTGKSCDIY